jgi:hypothetical protein
MSDHDHSGKPATSVWLLDHRLVPCAMPLLNVLPAEDSGSTCLIFRSIVSILAFAILALGGSIWGTLACSVLGRGIFGLGAYRWACI